MSGLSGDGRIPSFPPSYLTLASAGAILTNESEHALKDAILVEHGAIRNSVPAR